MKVIIYVFFNISDVSLLYIFDERELFILSNFGIFLR